MNKKDKEIYGLLTELKGLAQAFNQMIGNLYPGICAREMNEIMYKLEHKHKIKVNWYQPTIDSVRFTNLKDLLEKYENKEKRNRKGNRKDKAAAGTM